MVIFAAATPPTLDSGSVPISAAAETPAVSDDGGFVEEVVLDRYTALDAGLTPPDVPPPATVPEVPLYHQEPAVGGRQSETAIPAFRPDAPLSWNAALARINNAGEVVDRLDAVDEVLQVAAHCDPAAVFEDDDHSVDPSLDLARLCPTGDRTPEDQIGATVLEIMHDTREELASSEPESQSAVFEFGSDVPPTDMASQREVHAETEPRRYRHLFTMLRRKQQGRA